MAGSRSSDGNCQRNLLRSPFGSPESQDIGDAGAFDRWWLELHELLMEPGSFPADTQRLPWRLHRCRGVRQQGLRTLGRANASEHCAFHESVSPRITPGAAYGCKSRGSRFRQSSCPNEQRTIMTPTFYADFTKSNDAEFMQ